MARSIGWRLPGYKTKPDGGMNKSSDFNQQEINSIKIIKQDPKVIVLLVIPISSAGDNSCYPFKICQLKTGLPWQQWHYDHN